MHETNGGSSRILSPGADGPRVRPRSIRRHEPIIYSTLSMEGIRRLIVRHYNFDGPLECTFFCRGVSDTYLLSTPTRRFALKVYRSSWRTREAILCELAALQHVNARGIDVALPVARRDGDLITDIRAPEGMRSAVMFHWAPGGAPKYTDSRHALQYGRLIARLHAAADDLPPSSLRPRMDEEYLLRTPLARIRTRLNALPFLATRLEALAARTSARLGRASRQLSDWGFCHGDVLANNARIDGNQLVLFDFDFCGFGWRIYDLASYRWHARFVGVEQAAWKPFLAGYLQIRPAAADSLACIGVFEILRHLWRTAHFIGRAPETGTIFLSDEDLENAVPFCEAIEAEEASAQ